MRQYELLTGDTRTLLATLPDKSVQCCVTSPPYFNLRDYQIDGQIGLEKTPTEFVDALVDVFREVHRVLRDDGVIWVNLGDSIKSKNLLGIPWRVAFALQADGWYLRQDIIWHKPNPMPESVKDRCTKAHEYVFLLSKFPKYFYNADAIKQPYAATTMPRMLRGQNEGRYSNGAPGQSAHSLIKPRLHSKYQGQSTKDYKGANAQNPSDSKRRIEESILNGKGANKRSVWTVNTQSFRGAHFATFSTELVRPMIKAGSRPGDTILDPFSGAATTGLVALQEMRNYIGIELNPEYQRIAQERLDSLPNTLC